MQKHALGKITSDNPVQGAIILLQRACRILETEKLNYTIPKVAHRTCLCITEWHNLQPI